MATWEEKVAARKEWRAQQAKDAEESMKEMEEDLKKQKGFFASIGLLFVKFSRLAARWWFRGGNIAQPSTAIPLEETYTESLFEIPPSVWNNTIDSFASSMGLDAEGIKILKSFYQPLKGASPIVQGLSLVGVFLSMMQFFVTLGMGKMSQSLSVKYRPSLPTGGEVLGARALSEELDQQIWSVLRRNGYSDEDIKLMMAATYVRLPESVIRDLYYREGRGKDWALKELSKIGYTPQRSADLMAAWPFQPSVQDLIYMVGREAFEPTVQRMFGLDSPAPGEYLDMAGKVGYPAYWAQKMWEAHWEHPSLNQVLEMFHRDQLDWNQVYEYMTIVELPPFWREKIRDVAYNVITRVDARRMYGTGTMDEKQLFDAYRHMGYSPEDALKLVDFTIKYESGADRDVAKADILRAYAYKDIDRPQALAWLQQIGYNAEVSDFYLTQKDLETDREKAVKALELLKEKYTQHLIEKGEAQAGMGMLGLSPAAISEQLDRWDVARAKNTKLPSKTDMDKFLRAEVIDADTYKTEMNKLGYSDKYIKWYLALIQKGVKESMNETD